MAIIDEKIVPINMSVIRGISVVPLYNVRMLIIVVGNKVSELTFNSIKVVILLEGDPLLGLIFCSSLIAFNPSGVAADPRPNRFASIFEQMYSRAISSSFSSGKSFNNGFLKALVKFFISPLSIAILKIPPQNRITKATLKNILKASLDEFIMIFPMSFILPVKMLIIIPAINRAFQT